MILFRDAMHPRPESPRWPSWLMGAENLCRRESPKGDLVAITDPLVFPSGDGLKWLPVEDGWQVAKGGGADLPQLIRKRTDCQALTVFDGRGTSWLVPAILDPAGNVTMAVPLSSVSGKWAREPTDEQAGMIQAAQAARAEIVTNRLGQVPVEAACAWVCALLAGTYYLSPCTIGALALLDDYLIPRVLLAAAGFPPPET